MFHMFSTDIAWLTEFISGAEQTFMRSIRNALESTPGTIPNDFYLFALLSCVLSFLSIYLAEKQGRKLGTTHRTIHRSILLRPVTSPDLKTLEVKIIAASYTTPTQTHIWSHILLTNRTHCLLSKHHPLGCSCLLQFPKPLFFRPPLYELTR